MLKNLPKTTQEKLKNIYSPEEWEIVIQGFSQEKRPTTLRVNTLKSSNEEIESILQEKNIPFEKIPYLSNGSKLS